MKISNRPISVHMFEWPLKHPRKLLQLQRPLLEYRFRKCHSRKRWTVDSLTSSTNIKGLTIHDYSNIHGSVYIYIHTYITITLHYFTWHDITWHYIPLHTYIQRHLAMYMHMLYVYVPAALGSAEWRPLMGPSPQSTGKVNGDIMGIWLEKNIYFMYIDIRYKYIVNIYIYIYICKYHQRHCHRFRSWQ